MDYKRMSLLCVAVGLNIEVALEAIQSQHVANR